MSEIEQTLWVQVYLHMIKSTGDDDQAEEEADRAVRNFRRSDNYFSHEGRRLIV